VSRSCSAWLMLLAVLLSACAGVEDLTRAAQEVARRFPADSVTASLSDDGLLTIRLANSSIADLQDSSRAIISGKIAVVAESVFTRGITPARVSVRFTRKTRLGPISGTETIVSYTFRVYSDTVGSVPEGSKSLPSKMNE